ncbi:ribosome silencing factor [Frankia tisae]|uniref:ribosome silencing factor n=1 Tax=Frankia tisae TaxID=2950104 RepID=UPI0021C04BF8|nr:ribosome silencing factor [Frankia tisae]
MTASPRAVELALAAAQAAADKLGHDLLILDVSERLAITDCFVLASAGNERQVKGIVDEVEEKLRPLGAKPVRREGEREGHWVLLDFVDVVVHVQRDEERVFYSLERLWKDCPVIPFTDATVGAAAGAATSASASGASSAAGSLGGGSANAL